MEKISENLLDWTNKMKQTRNSLAELNEVQYKDFLFQNVLTLKLSSIMIFGVIPPHHRYFSVAQLYVLMLTVNVFFPIALLYILVKQIIIHPFLFF